MGRTGAKVQHEVGRLARRCRCDAARTVVFSRGFRSALPLAVAAGRLATGVPGLDAVLGGGLPEFSFNVIAGPPGCGKTTLAHQLMFALATPARPALYFTVLGEPPLKMLRYQQQFHFFDSESINRSIRFINLADETQQGDLTQVLRCTRRSVPSA
jgi:predicted ATP-dependent serine protease